MLFVFFLFVGGVFIAVFLSAAQAAAFGLLFLLFLLVGGLACIFRVVFTLFFSPLYNLLEGGGKAGKAEIDISR